MSLINNISRNNQAFKIAPVSSQTSSCCLTTIFKKIISIIQRVFSSETYYFAYGSNMSQSRLQARVGNVSSLGLAELEKYRFAFNKRGSDGSGKANIVSDNNASVQGVVYKVSNDQLTKLDRFEGTPNHYLRYSIRIKHPQKGTIRAITYIAHPDKTTPHNINPSSEYLNHILTGARENNLSQRHCRAIQQAAQ